MSDIVTGDFNYSSVDEDTAAKLESFARDGKRLIRKSQIQFIAEFGEVLCQARDILADHYNGKFIKWATAEFDISAKTVYNYLNAWDRVLCNDYTTYLHWSATAVYLASSDDLPKPVQKKLAAMASKDMVREADVKRVIEAAKPQPIPADEPDDPATTNSEDVPFDDPEPAETKPERTAPEQAKLNRQLAQSLIYKAVRAVDDLHHVKPNEAKRAAAVKSLQGVMLW